jgi:hypothetical protein
MGKTHFGLVFDTARGYPVLTSLYNLFYVNGRKAIPSFIAELLTPQGLAMWAMCDFN